MRNKKKSIIKKILKDEKGGCSASKKYSGKGGMAKELPFKNFKNLIK